jgi:hypothetical protein
MGAKPSKIDKDELRILCADVNTYIEKLEENKRCSFDRIVKNSAGLIYLRVSIFM